MGLKFIMFTFIGSLGGEMFRHTKIQTPFEFASKFIGGGVFGVALFLITHRYIKDKGKELQYGSALFFGFIDVNLFFRLLESFVRKHFKIEDTSKNINDDIDDTIF